MLLVSDANSSSRRRPAFSCSHGRTMWKYMPYAKRGWSISAIARHTGFDRKTVRKYLAGQQKPGVRARPALDPFDPFVDYITARLIEDPHLWARTLYDELENLGFGLSYQSLTRNIRARGLRPVCAPCRTVTERPNAIIAHPPGDENPVGLAGIAEPA